MNEAINKRANQLLNDKEHGHELTWDKAIRIATEEAADRDRAAQSAQREMSALNTFRSSLVAAGVAEAAAKTLAANHFELPEMIQVGRLAFTDAAKAAAVKAAIRTLWLALGLGEPDFTPFDFDAERNRKHQGWIQFPG